MWYLRKFYGGKDGALPPTDPRILAMTPAQIELEFEHMNIDAKLQKGEAFEDDEFDEYDKSSDASDSLLSETPTFVAESDPRKGFEASNSNEQVNEEEWEEVEIDNLETQVDQP